MRIRARLLALAIGILVSALSSLDNSVLAQAPNRQPPLPPQALVNSLGTVDTERVLNLSGVVKFVQVGPYRSFVQVLVTLPNGQVQEWSLEGPSRQIMARLNGNRMRPVGQWDQVTFSINPLKDVAAAGEIRALTAANGVALVQ